MVPHLRDVAVFYASSSRKNTAYERTERTAHALGLEVRGWAIASTDELETTFQDAVGEKFQAVDVLAAPFFNVDANRELLTRFAEKYRLPAIYESGEYVRSGGLIAYGPVFVDMARRGATLVDKILKGADPGDIPVEITTKFALTINLKAAAALGLEVPPALLAAADEVIE
jgi:putative ABC transport system substrate-binding protein